MPVRGRPPKENPQDGGKRRSHEEVELGSAPLRNAPTIGKRPGGGAWLPEVKAYFETWRRSPQASMFIATDWQSLRRCCWMLDLTYRGEAPAGWASVITTLEAKLGATVADRHMLRMKVRAPGAKPAADVGEKQEPARPKGRDTRRLQVVS